MSNSELGFQELLNKVCGELPEGFQIVIIAENGYAGCHLINEDGDDVEVEQDTFEGEDSLQEEVLELLRVAKL